MAKKNKQRNRVQDGQQDPNAPEVQDDTTEEEVEDGEVEETPAEETQQEPQHAPEQVRQATPEERARATYQLPSDWTDAEVNEWIDRADHVTIRTSRNNFVFDPTRTHRNPTLWDMGEVSDWMEGKLNTNLTDATADILVQRYAERNGSDSTKGWGRVEWVNFIDSGVEPKRTETGYLVESSVRDKADLSTLSQGELEELLKGNITITASRTAELVDVVKKVFHLPAAVSSFEEAQAAFKAHATDADDKPSALGLKKVEQANIEHELNEYYEAVKPGKEVDDAIGLRAQLRLDAVFSYCNAIDGQGFVSAMNIVADFVKKHRDGLFNDTYAFRFIHLLNGTSVNVRAHVATITGLTILASNNPGKIKQHDLRFLLSGLPEDRAGRVADYFQARGAELSRQRNA